jgi:hypothetical protein
LRDQLCHGLPRSVSFGVCVIDPIDVPNAIHGDHWWREFAVHAIGQVERALFDGKRSRRASGRQRLGFIAATTITGQSEQPPPGVMVQPRVDRTDTRRPEAQMCKAKTDARVSRDPSACWTRRCQYVVNRRTLRRGTEVSIRGERGRFRFLGAVETSTGALWLDFIGGPAKAEKWRSFHPDRVRRVHRINKTRANLT